MTTNSLSHHHCKMIRWSSFIKLHRKKFWTMSSLRMFDISVSRHSALYSIKHSKTTTTTISGLTSRIRIWWYNIRCQIKSKNQNKSNNITHCRISSMAFSIYNNNSNNFSSWDKIFLKHTYQPMLQQIYLRLGFIVIVIHLFSSKDEISSRSCRPAC